MTILNALLNSGNVQRRRWLLVIGALILTIIVAWVSGAPSERRAISNISVLEAGNKLQTTKEKSEQTPAQTAASGAAPASNSTMLSASAPVNAGPLANRASQRRDAWNDRRAPRKLRLRPAQLERLGRLLKLDPEGMTRLQTLNASDDSAAGQPQTGASALERREAMTSRLAALADIVRTSPAYREDPDAFGNRPLIKLLLQRNALAATPEVAP